MPNPTTDSIMYRTLVRQPDDLRRLLADGWGPARDAADLIRDARRIVLTGVGTSYHAALAGGWLLRAAGRDARAVLSYDLATYPESYPLGPDDAVVVMAHTGVKSYTKIALDRAVQSGATVVSVGSRAAEHPGSRLVLRTIDRETSAAYTSSHLCAMATLAMLADELGQPSYRTHLEALPDQIAGIIDRQETIRPIAERAAGQKVYAFGGGPSEVTALELVIKAREAALHPVDALQTEQFFHGPIVAANAGDLAVVVASLGGAPQHPVWYHSLTKTRTSSCRTGRSSATTSPERSVERRRRLGGSARSRPTRTTPTIKRRRPGRSRSSC